jgi:hypothetical protein
MNRTHFILMLAVALTVISLAAFLSLPGQAQTTGQQPDGAVSVTAASVSSRINYQGVLKEGGAPVTGSRNFTFRFYTAAGCATPVGSPIVLNGVAVANGLFSVKLDVDQALFDGQGLWLGVDVGSTGNVTCEEIVPVPYALSLRPGAVIVGNIAGSAVISVTNTYSPTVGAAAPANGEGQGLHGSGVSSGVFGDTVNGDGVAGLATGVGTGVRGTSVQGNGGEFSTAGADAYGLVARNRGGGFAARFDGKVWFNGDVHVAGEVYANSLHTTDGSGARTSGVTTSGDGTWKSVTVPQTGGGNIWFTATGLDVKDSAGNSKASIGSNGDASLKSVSVPQTGGGNIWFTATGLDVKDSAGNSKASIGSNGDASLKSVSVPQTLTGGGEMGIKENGMYVKNLSGALWASISSSGHGFFNSVSTGRSSAPPAATINADGVAYFMGLTVAGPKSAAVSTASYGERKLYADESAEVYFFDRGGGQLVNGVAVIALDPVWLETVTIDADHPMRVQVTLTGDCNGVYVAEKTATGFTVRELRGGASNATFDWEVAAKRKGYEDVRLEPAEIR